MTDGLYGYVRHPQYLGFILLTGGWLLHWPTVPTALMWPFLLALYYRLAKKEEKEMARIFGEEYLAYAERVSMLLPIRRIKG